MSKSNTKRTFIINLHCSMCQTFLYRYRKEGPGTLVKCYVSGILVDATRGDMKCPNCGQMFARFARYHNRDAHKIIGGKVLVKGHVKK